jgi:hypothetical protein
MLTQVAHDALQLLGKATELFTILGVIKMRSASRMKRLGAAAVLQELPFN